MRIQQKLSQHIPDSKLQQKIMERMKEGANNDDIQALIVEEEGSIMDFNENLMQMASQMR